MAVTLSILSRVVGFHMQPLSPESENDVLSAAGVCNETNPGGGPEPGRNLCERSGRKDQRYNECIRLHLALISCGVALGERWNI
jgi:hypothetical protein